MNEFIFSEDDWENVGFLLEEMSLAYTGDNVRKLTFNNEIFPLVLRFENGERSPELYQEILRSQEVLMKNIYRQISFKEPCRGFFMNPRIKPAYSDLLDIVGTQEENWKKLVHYLSTELRLKVSMKFNDEVEGWVIDFHKAGKTKAYLVPDKNNFRVFVAGTVNREIEATTTDNIREIFPIIRKEM